MWLLAFALILASIANASTTALPIVGTWEGKANDLPAVELTVRVEDRGVAGTIAFYFQTRGEDGRWRLGPKTEMPLLSARLEGKVLTFETTHHKRHGSPELGPNNRYRVEFVNANEARLHMYKAGQTLTDNGGPGLKLTRHK